MNLDLVKKRLETLNNVNSKSKVLWKPEAGKQNVIRIIPYKKNPENPFIELMFHYGINGKSYLSPSTFGRPDPFVEFAESLKKRNNKEDWKTGKKFEPKLRTYVPVLVRGEEHEGVKYWGFGKQVYQAILGIIDDPDYGDITDPTQGRDITVTYIEGNGADFAKTEIRPKPKQTPMTTDKSVLEKIKNQPDLTDVFEELSYDELATVLKNFLQPDEEEGSQTEAMVSDSVDSEETSEGKPEKTSVTATTAKANTSVTTSTSDLEEQFNDLFS